MRRLPRSLVHAFLGLSMAVWVFSGVASGLHHLLVQHVVCAAHGEIVEVDGHHGEVALADDGVDGPQIAAADALAHHDHGCSDQLTDLLGLPAAPAKPPGFLVLKRVLEPMRGASSTRGPPPLSYAPKTSPPLA